MGAPRVIVERGAEAAGLRVEVGRIDVSLMRQEVSIEDISLTSSTGGALRSLRCRSALATVRLADLARGRVALAEVSVAQPDLEVGSADPASAGAKEHAAFSGWPVQVDRISILDARVRARISEGREVDVHIPAVLATDLELPGAGGETPWRLADLRVERSQPSSLEAEGEQLSVSFSGKASNAAPDAAFPIEVELARADATLTLSGLVHIGELRIDGSISASQVEIAPLLARVDRTGSGDRGTRQRAARARGGSRGRWTVCRPPRSGPRSAGREGDRCRRSGTRDLWARAGVPSPLPKCPPWSRRSGSWACPRRLASTRA